MYMKNTCKQRQPTPCVPVTRPTTAQHGCATRHNRAHEAGTNNVFVRLVQSILRAYHRPTLDCPRAHACVRRRWQQAGGTSRPSAVAAENVLSRTRPLTNLGAPSSLACRLASSVPWHRHHVRTLSDYSRAIPVGPQAALYFTLAQLTPEQASGQAGPCLWRLCKCPGAGCPLALEPRKQQRYQCGAHERLMPESRRCAACRRTRCAAPTARCQ